jgi:hypothetical protein
VGVAAVLIGGVVLGAVQWAAGVERAASDEHFAATKTGGRAIIPRPAQDPQRSTAPNDVTREPDQSPRVQLVTTVSGLADRVGTLTRGASAATDEDLMSALRATGQDPGLVRVDGRLVIAGDFGR